jgi:membrane-associated phospholipid phosphatase
MAGATRPATPRQILKGAVAPRPTRRYRARLFQAYVLVASAAFVVLAVLAHTRAYFSLDLTITRFVQSYHGAWFSHLMYAVSWLGFGPQTWIIGISIVLALYLAGLRWEAVALAFSSLVLLICLGVKAIVTRPRPSPDLVRVLFELNSPAFPSGHVLQMVCVGGFLAFLAFTLLKPSIGRTIALVVLGALTVLMGLSRIALGQHWFSDVVGAYLLGSLWLALTIRVYRWGKTRFFVHQPVAADPDPTT